jgi:hypothetical protein
VSTEKHLQQDLLDEHPPRAFLDESEVEPEDTGSDEVITKPFDPTLIRVETKIMTIDLLISRIRLNEIDLMPSFQRRSDIWKEEAQSRLIESILIRIPLPAFYMDATDEDRWLVVDGLQRLSTLKRFIIENNLKLTGLEFLTQFSGKIYNDLPRNFQRRIGETQVTVYLIEKGTPADVKFNVFKRINTGGLPLSAQEIRHALNQGPATKLLANLAGSEVFKRATDYGVNPKRMDDRECVLRFLSFVITPYSDYLVKDLDTFLNEKMAAINKMDVTQRQSLEQRFIGAMQAAYRILGRDAFRKKYSPRSGRFPINKALFEAWSVNLDSFEDEEITKLEARKSDVVQRFMELMGDRDFEAAVSAGTGDIKKVKKRFGAIKNLLHEVLK